MISKKYTVVITCTRGDVPALDKKETVDIDAESPVKAAIKAADKVRPRSVSFFTLVMDGYQAVFRGPKSIAWQGYLEPTGDGSHGVKP